MAKNNIFLFSGALLGIFCALLTGYMGWETGQSVVAGTVITMATWWISECIPIYVTALIPLVIFPLFNVVPMKDLAPRYMQDIIFLFIGGFLVAYAIERAGLHKRIALKLILISGSSMSRVLLGFMLASYLLSMWILNTATVTMLMPAVLAVLIQLGQQGKKLASPLLLGIAYASSIGGMATLVGTLPNMIIKDAFDIYFSDQSPITFASWMVVGLPVSAALFIFTYFLLRRKYLRNDSSTVNVESCRKEYDALGPMNSSEKWMVAIFALLAVAWLTLKEIHIGDVTIFGWANWFPNPDAIKESTVAMFFAVILFLIPRKPGKELAILEDVRRIPVGIIFLFGSGYALVDGFTNTGLSQHVQEALSFTSDLSPFLVVITLCLTITFLTELTSNTTSINLFIPILFPLAMNLKSAPLELILPVTFCASCAFMLPVATPPNTIVFGSERLPIREMVRTGIVLNLVSVLIISVLTFLLV